MKKKSKFKTFLQSLKTILLKAVLIVFLFTLLQVFALKFVNPPITPNVAWEICESIIKKDPSKKPDYRFVDIEEISPHLRRAVLAAEDQRFLLHNGFDTTEIMNAVNRFMKTRRLRGASTISMQTARSVFLLSSRSGFRKAAEIYYTILIELMWDKQRILEMYLNTVDWGTAITGAEAAAQNYFGVSAKNLNRYQAALMTAVLPNPHRWSVKRPTDYLRERQTVILKSMPLMPLL